MKKVVFALVLLVVAIMLLQGCKQTSSISLVTGKVTGDTELFATVEAMVKARIEHEVHYNGTSADSFSYITYEETIAQEEFYICTHYECQVSSDSIIVSE